MKFRSEQGQLAEALGALARVATSRSSANPALSGVRMSLLDDSLTLSATDIDIFLQFTLPVAGDRNGDALIGAALINDIVRSLPGGKVVIDAGADSASVTGERAQFTVPLLNVVDFPKTNIAPANPVTISAAELSRALAQVVSSASKDSNKQNLTAVQFSSSESGLRLAATDSYRMAIKEMPDANLLTFGQAFLIPRRALAEIQRLLDDADTVSIRFGEIDTTFETTRMQMTTRLINATFPNVVNFIKPTYSHKFVAPREPLIEALRRSRVLARENTPVKLTMTPQGMRIVVQTNDLGASAEDVDGQMTGGDITAGFNPDYFREGVEAAQGDEVSIEMNDPTQPAVLRGVGDSSFTYLLMPQRVH